MELDRCRDLRPSFPGFVVGTNPKAIDLRIQVHLSEGCATCAVQLEELQDAFHSIPLAAGPQPLLEGAADLMARNVAATPQAEQIVPIQYPETNERRLGLTLLILFGIALAAAAFWGRTQLDEVHDARVTLQSERARTREAVGQYRELQARAQRVDMLLDAVTNPRISSHDLRPGASGARARAFVDAETGSLTLSVTALPGPAPFTLQWGVDDLWTDIGTLPNAAATRGGAQSFPLPEGAALPAALRILDASQGVIIQGPLEPPP